jgi:Ca2+-binding EF-hand superfamily protein
MPCAFMTLTLCSEAFLSVDSDRNGLIDKSEIKAMLQK